ncbi:MAG: tyrosine-type recombinase/integrase [Firmicutes bacterium]|nr:tyrosine-type recombinase/integrase [Bacillota bacterium]
MAQAPEAVTGAARAFLLALRQGGRSEGTLRRYRRVLDDLLDGGLAQALGDEEASPATRRLRHAVLSRFFRWAVAEGLLQANPLANRPPPRLHEQVPRSLPADELSRLGEAVRAQPLRIRALFTLILECGLREAEATALRVRDVDLSTRGQEGVRVRGKGGKERFVPLPPGYESRALLRRLAAGRDGAEFVFTARGGMPLTTSAVRKAWARIRRAAGVDGYSVHSLRHTAATRMLERTGDLQLVSRLLGHSSVAVTARYTLRGDSALRRAMEDAGGGWRR